MKELSNSENGPAMTGSSVEIADAELDILDMMDCFLIGAYSQ